MASETVLLLDGYDPTASSAEVVVALPALAAGEPDVPALADRFRTHSA